MSTVFEKMKSGMFPILVSLPQNNLALARAAMEGGADGVKVHLNTEHRASGNVFGSFNEERPFLESLSELGISRSIMIGEKTLASPLELQSLSAMGFEFFDLYLKYAKPYLFESNLRPMLALDDHFDDTSIEQVKTYKNAVIEASIVNPADYGQALNVEDLNRYKHIVESSGLKVIVPSQKKVITSDLEKLRDTGVHSLLIGVIVTGRTSESILKTTREFVTARDALLLKS
jgi:hypothetical protein